MDMTQVVEAINLVSKVISDLSINLSISLLIIVLMLAAIALKK